MQREKRRIIAIILAVQALCIIGVFLGLGIAFLAQPRVDNHGSLELTAARGAQVRFSISADASIHGLWAAPGGIQVPLGNNVTYYSRYVEVLEPSHSLDSIPDLTDVSDQHLDNTTIPIDLTLPDDIPGPAAQTLQGETTRYIFLPVPATSGGYEVVERELDVSLKIHLAPAVPTLYQIRYHPEPLGFGLVAIATLAFVVYTVIVLQRHLIAGCLSQSLRLSGAIGVAYERCSVGANPDFMGRALLSVAEVIGAELLYWSGVRDVAALKAAVDTKRLLRALRHKDTSVRREAALACAAIQPFCRSWTHCAIQIAKCV
jgi:hypothetical protein